ncbi:MAG: hypothetical protein EBT86_03880, partial [Actinobacteria bacterium]|nr:hypothetical protein [Actinomycetota bacterium]
LNNKSREQCISEAKNIANANSNRKFVQESIVIKRQAAKIHPVYIPYQNEYYTEFDNQQNPQYDDIFSIIPNSHENSRSRSRPKSRSRSRARTKTHARKVVRSTPIYKHSESIQESQHSPTTTLSMLKIMNGKEVQVRP